MFDIYKMNAIFKLFLISGLFYTAYASIGDSSPFYQKCIEKCAIVNCTNDGLDFINEALQPIYLRLLKWTCQDECKYGCMWKTVDSFHKRKWKTPQFHGKWPFTRILGVQEPASVIFSLMNLYAHFRMFKKFRAQVAKDSPTYLLWSFFTAVCMHAWIWSTIFHTRDVIFTEFMDYTCAFSMVVMSFYCMMTRMFLNMPKFVKHLLKGLHLAFFLNHVGYLSQGIDYGYNMKVNVIIGSINAITWFSWCMWNRKDKPYTWKCAIFYTIAGLTMVLEIFDFPPILWIFDSHSLWHFATAVITPIFYWFIIDDCNYLSYQKKMKVE